jgi:uncharacterized NAD(P)/FAD-binding protein YdhS
VGGGFTGTTLAAQLLRQTDPSVSVVVIEKAGLPGRGLAYGTGCASHLLNVPAKDMSALSDDPGHFLRWAKLKFGRKLEPCSFLPRREYGRYLGAVLHRAAASTAKGRLLWKKDEACGLSETRDGKIEIRLRSGGAVVAEKVVLALGNFPSSDPHLPGRSNELAAPDQYFSSPWSEGSFAGASHLRSVLLLGSGLTSVDAAVELRAQGFSGTIHMLSRRGLLPQPHAQHQAWPAFWRENSARDIRSLVRLVRTQVREAKKAGIDWRGVINSLRDVTPQIWQSLPMAEKRRFLRHVRPYWEVHRHRAAPEIGQFLDAQRSSDSLRLHAGRIASFTESAAGVEVTYRERKSGKEICLSVDRVINCTAPETDCRQLRDPLLDSLLAQGLAHPDPLFLGLDTSGEGALIDRHGTPSDSLYAVGPVRKASLWESTAVPELREQVRKLAQHLVASDALTHVVATTARHEASGQAANA